MNAMLDLDAIRKRAVAELSYGYIPGGVRAVLEDDIPAMAAEIERLRTACHDGRFWCSTLFSLPDELEVLDMSEPELSRAPTPVYMYRRFTDAIGDERPLRAHLLGEAGAD